MSDIIPERLLICAISAFVRGCDESCITDSTDEIVQNFERKTITLNAAHDSSRLNL
jgi:hypothetical protein